MPLILMCTFWLKKCGDWEFLSGMEHIPTFGYGPAVVMAQSLYSTRQIPDWTPLLILVVKEVGPVQDSFGMRTKLPHGSWGNLNGLPKADSWRTKRA